MVEVSAYLIIANAILLVSLLLGVSLLCSGKYGQNNGKVVMYRFYRPGCPYCVSSQEEWNKFKLAIGRDHPLYEIYDVNQDTATPQEQALARKYRVSGVPTVVKVKNGKYVIYDGPRTSVEYQKFLKN